MYHIRKAFLLVAFSLFAQFLVIAGPGDGMNSTGGFGKSDRNLGFVEMNSIQSDEDPGPGGGPGGWSPPEAIPIDGGVLLVLASGLLLGGRKIIRQLMN